MNKRIRPVSVLIILSTSLMACASPVSVSDSEPSTSDQVATIVALTLQAVTPEVTELPSVDTGLLPNSLYFIGKDNEWVNQVYRMERDGKTKTQLTFESDGVDGYDVSTADGNVAYIANNQLVLIEADGSNRRVLVDGGPKENNARVTRPVFSPDGGTLAYAHKGLNLYSLSTGISSLVIEDQYGDPLPEGQRLPIEIYLPESYSPDGMKLLVALGHWEVAPSHAVYYPATKDLVRYEEVQDYIYCCSFHGGPAWSPDSSSFYGVASVHDTAYQSGELWKVDAATGSLTRMLRAENGILDLPKEIYPAPDGQLYFFLGRYSETSGYFDAPILQMVRALPKGGTDIAVLRDDNFRLMQEALWAPDASFVIVATAPERNWDQGGGVLELYYTKGQKAPVWLAPLGKQMKWGS